MSTGLGASTANVLVGLISALVDNTPAIALGYAASIAVHFLGRTVLRSDGAGV